MNTPRTDAVAYELLVFPDPAKPHAYRMESVKPLRPNKGGQCDADFARQLETELAEVRAQEQHLRFTAGKALSLLNTLITLGHMPSGGEQVGNWSHCAMIHDDLVEALNPQKS